MPSKSSSLLSATFLRLDGSKPARERCNSEDGCQRRPSRLAPARHEDDKKIIFSSLNTLELSAVSFASVEQEMMLAFNICNLSRFKLWNCPSSLALLNKNC